MKGEVPISHVLVISRNIFASLTAVHGANMVIRILVEKIMFEATFDYIIEHFAFESECVAAIW